MDFSRFLALELNVAQKMLIHEGYRIEKIEFLNEPPGSLRVVRVQETSVKTVSILAAYHYDPLEKD